MSQPKNQSTYNCNDCKDTGYIIIKTINNNDAIKPCYCLFKKTKEKYFGKLYTDKTINNYEPRNESMKKAKEYIINNPNSSFYIYGDVGLGKTHLLAGIYEKMFKNGEWLTTKIYTELQLINEIKSGEHDIDSYEIIFIDDVGKIQLPSWNIDTLYQTYNDIYRFKKQVIISSNYSIEEIVKIYGGAIGRRIDTCDVLKIEKSEAKQ